MVKERLAAGCGGAERDIVVRPAEKLVRARDIEHVDLVVYRNADEHLSCPRLRKLTNFTGHELYLASVTV